MITYNKFMEQFKERMSYKIKEDYLPLHEVSTIVHDPPKIIDVNSLISTSCLRLTVTPRVNPPYLKCIHMVEK